MKTIIGIGFSWSVFFTLTLIFHDIRWYHVSELCSLLTGLFFCWWIYATGAHFFEKLHNLYEKAKNDITALLRF